MNAAKIAKPAVIAGGTGATSVAIWAISSAPVWLQIAGGFIVVAVLAVAYRSGLIEAWLDDLKEVARSRTGHRKLVGQLGQQMLTLPVELQPNAIASYLHLKDGQTAPEDVRK